MLFYVLFSIDSRGLDHGNFLQQLRKYEFVTPQLHAHGRWKRDTSTQTNSVSDEPIPYSDIHSVCAISQLFPLTVVYFASMNRIKSNSTSIDTYSASPNPTLTITSHFLQNVGLAEE